MIKKWADPEAKAEAERYDNPIPSRTLILSTLEQLKTAKSHAELVDHFNIPDQKSIDALSHRLSAMVRDGQLMKDGFKYQPATDLPSHEATVAALAAIHFLAASSAVIPPSRSAATLF